MTRPLVDISDRYIPSPSPPHVGGAAPVRAISPNRIFPPRDAVEVLYHAFIVAGAGVFRMLNPNTGTSLSDFIVPADYQGHIDYGIFEFPNNNPGAFPNNTFVWIAFNPGANLINSQQWNIFPFMSSGSALSVACTFPTPINLDVPPATTVELVYASSDAATHHVDAYLHAWVWPKTENDG